MSGISNSEKNELLFERGINYNDLPSWQKRGICMYYCSEQRQGLNPITNATTTYTRHALHMEMELPMGQEYSQLLHTILEDMNKEKNVQKKSEIKKNLHFQCNIFIFLLL